MATILDMDSVVTLNERAVKGEQAISISWNLDTDERVDGDDREAAAKDAISNILTALFGAAGHYRCDNPALYVRVNNDFALNEARRLIEQAFVSWEGDAEDYTAPQEAA